MDAIIINWISAYGVPAIAFLCMLGSAGIPLPTTLVVIFSGVLMRQGWISIFPFLPITLGATVLGDIILYGAGWLSRNKIDNRMKNSNTWHKAQAFFSRHGSIAVYLTRWLITSLGIGTSFAAGNNRYPFLKFLFFDVAGELTWLLVYGAVGYFFSSQWQQINSQISQFSSIAALVIGVVLVLAWFVYRKTRLINHSLAVLNQ